MIREIQEVTGGINSPRLNDGPGQDTNTHPAVNHKPGYKKGTAIKTLQ